MRKTQATIIFILLSTIATAQSPWQLGGKSGVNFTTISGEGRSLNEPVYKWAVTPVFGAVGAYLISDLFAINAELNLAKWGANSEGFGNDGPFYFKERYTSIQIPVTGRFTFGKDWQFFVYGGFYWSVSLYGKYVFNGSHQTRSGKIKLKKRPNDYSGDDVFKDPKYYRRMDVGANLGGGVQKKVGPGMLALDLRFGMGFLDGNKWENRDYSKPDGYKPYTNRTISLNLAYALPVGK